MKAWKRWIFPVAIWIALIARACRLFAQEVAQPAVITSLVYSLQSYAVTNADGSIRELPDPSTTVRWYRGPTNAAVVLNPPVPEARRGTQGTQVTQRTQETQGAPLPPQTDGKYWEVQCGCGKVFHTGAAFDRVTGGRILANGGRIEEHSVRAFCTACGRECDWTREVKLGRVKAREVSGARYQVSGVKSPKGVTMGN